MLIERSAFLRFASYQLLSATAKPKANDLSKLYGNKSVDQ
jgi:hypothetical protein